jgi:molecular chaperone GrpE (heat shock protein)
MRDQAKPGLSKWPFLLGDFSLLAAATAIALQQRHPLSTGPAGLVVACVLAGAALGILPFVLEYRALVRLAEADRLDSVVSQIGKLEEIASQISAATGQWQNVQGEAEKVSIAAKKMTERMEAEAQAFTEFMQKVNDGERATLRLEVEKMQRGEKDWLQVAIRMLDHVYALNVGAVRSGQPNLIAQLSNFQNACREAARRVGLTPFIAEPAEVFDANRHQLLDEQKSPSNGAIVTETVATGYTFQGRLLRPALVKLRENNGESGDTDERQSHLPLETPASTS